MNHLSDETIFQLAEKSIALPDYNNIERDEMYHIRQCDECYRKFCSALSVAEVTSPLGYSELSNILSFSSSTVKEFAQGKICATIHVVRQHFSDTVSAIMTQLHQVDSLLSFAAASPIAARGDSDDETIKLEEENGEDTWIVYDPESEEVAIRLTLSELPSDNIRVLISSEGFPDRDIPLQKTGDILMGYASGINNDDFKIRIETI